MGEIHKAGNHKKKLEMEEAINVSTYMSQAGNMKAHLTSPLMYIYHADTPYIEFPIGLHVDFYKDSSLVESIIDAKYSRYFSNQGKILLQDSVVVHNLLTGDSLKTNEMWWDQNQHLFYGSKHVVMYMKGMQNTQGIGWTCKQDFSQYTIDSNTTGTMQIPENMGL